MEAPLYVLISLGSTTKNKDSSFVESTKNLGFYFDSKLSLEMLGHGEVFSFIVILLLSVYFLNFKGVKLIDFGDF